MLRGSVRSRRGQKGGRGAWGLRKEDEFFFTMKKDGNATSGGGEVKYGVRCKVFLIDLLSVQVFLIFSY